MTDRDPLGTDPRCRSSRRFADAPADWDDVLGAPGRRRRARRSRRAGGPRRCPGSACSPRSAPHWLADPFGGRGDRRARSRAGGGRRRAGAARGHPLGHGRHARRPPERGSPPGPDRARDLVRSGSRFPRDHPPRGRPCSRSTARRSTSLSAFARPTGRCRCSPATTATLFETGRARVLREGEVAGTPVYWIRIKLERRAPEGHRVGAMSARTWPFRVRPTSRSTCSFGPPGPDSGSGSSSSRACRPAAARSPGTQPPRRSPASSRCRAGASIARPRADCSRRRSSGPASPGRPPAPAHRGGWGTRIPLHRFDAAASLQATNHVITLVYGGRGELMVNEARRYTYGLLRGPGAPGPSPSASRSATCRRGARPWWHAAGTRRSCAEGTS